VPHRTSGGGCSWSSAVADPFLLQLAAGGRVGDCPTAAWRQSPRVPVESPVGVRYSLMTGDGGQLLPR
jgi:hypothetical protein